MKRWRVCAVLLVGTAGLARAQSNDARRIQDHIDYLASDQLQGRGVGTAGLDSAGAYIAREFARIGLTQPNGDGFFQVFDIDPTAPAVAHAGLDGARVRNVVGILPGRGPLAGQVVVVGAHYDHLGLGGMGSLDPDSVGVVHNGADDNASGAATLIEIARRLRARAAGDRRTIVFVAFTAEELGLIGSTYYTKHPVLPNDSAIAMINLDMVGRLDANKLMVFGTETAPEFDGLLDSLNAIHQFALEGSGDGWGRSDQQSFYAVDVPVLHLFTGTHVDYHRVTDDADKINADGAARVGRFAADLVWSLAGRVERPTYVAIPQPAPVAGGYGAWLGTIPDMSESPGGVRLTGVRSGSPAEAAGILGGDIITRIGDHDVADLYGMTDALSAHKPGDVVTIVVLRDGQTLELTATLGQRGS
ncbi:MAG TPA: M28 family peptidase [Gemmatimonadales bacterium]